MQTACLLSGRKMLERPKLCGLEAAPEKHHLAPGKHLDFLSTPIAYLTVKKCFWMRVRPLLP